MVSREVICGDAFTHGKFAGSVVTSLPDLDETEMSLFRWRHWFAKATELVLGGIDPKSYAIFYQTDRKINGVWADKAAIIGRVAEEMCIPCRWHKIVLSAKGPGSFDLRRPTYSHLTCFSREGKPGGAWPDVLFHTRRLYERGMPIGAAAVACQFLKLQGAHVVTDPFCGYGTTLAAAEALALDSIGIDIVPELVERSRALHIETEVITCLHKTLGISLLQPTSRGLTSKPRRSRSIATVSG